MLVDRDPPMPLVQQKKKKKKKKNKKKIPERNFRDPLTSLGQHANSNPAVCGADSLASLAAIKDSWQGMPSGKNRQPNQS